MVGAVGPHHNPLLPRTHLPLLKYWYLGDEESGRKSRPIGSMLVPHPRPLQVFPSLHTFTSALSPRPTRPAIRPPSSPACMSLLWEGLMLTTCPIRYSPVPPGIHLSLSHLAPAPTPMSQATHPRGWGRTATACPSCMGVGAGLRRGWEEAPWVPGGLEPTAFPGGALRIRTGALRSEEGAGSWPGLLQVGTPQGPPHYLPWVWVWGLIPTLSTPCWRLCPRARPP